MNDAEKTGYSIIDYIRLHPDDWMPINDLLQLCRHLGVVNVSARQFAQVVRSLCEQKIINGQLTIDDVERYHELLSRALYFASTYDFDAYCQALEWNRPLQERFYLPRRDKIKPIITGLQELFDDKIDILSISAPPGVGKSTIGIYYVSFLMGLKPNGSIIMSGYSTKLTAGFHIGVNQILTDPDYRWNDIFQGVNIVRVNSNDQIIDLLKPNRNPTLTCRSIDGSLTGIARCTELLYCDDLVSGIEEAVSLPRLDSKFSKYVTDLRSRKKDRCKELHIATRWSVHDVIGRLERQYADSERAKFIVMKALNENDESNFDFDYGVRFSTKYFLDMRSIMDDVSWRALFMNEPIEREGLLYPEYELKRYYELPKDEQGGNLPPDAIIAVCDTKETGSDFYFSPIAYVYGDNYYIEDCYCSDGVVGNDAGVAALYIRHQVQQAQFESNSAGGRTADEVQRLIREQGGFTHITKKYTTTNKETKIIVNSEWVKEHCFFKDKSVIKPRSHYATMIKQLTSYSQKGKNKHDDVPDGMAMLAVYSRYLSQKPLVAMANPFW